MDFLSFDKKLFFLINHGASNAFFDAIMPFITAKGYLLLLPYLAYILYNASVEQKTKKESPFNVQFVLLAILFSVSAFLLSDWLGNEIKHRVMRIRPCNALEGVKLLAGCTKSYSMPSNHATNSFAFAVTLFYFTRRHIRTLLSAYPLFLACLVAISRVYVGVHYPYDIMVGALLGTTISCLIIAFYRYAGQQYKTKPETALLFTGLAVISIFRIYYILHGPLDLSPDEAHYWEWSRRLDLSYYSKGPMMAYLIYTGTSIFGDTVFGIRIMAVIFSALSSVFLFKLVNLMYVDQGAGAMNKRLASSSALLFQVIPLFAPFGVLFTIDSPFVFFWIISLFFLYKSLINEPGAEKWPNWLLSGFFIGLGLLTKYTMAFFYICGFLLLLLSEKRYLLKTFKPYAALAFSLVIFSPVIIWNIQHDWVTLRHTAGQAHVAEGIKISLTTFFEFMGTQIGVITPVLFGLMIYSLFRLRTSERGLQSKFLFYFSVPVVCFFLLKSLQAKVQANWAMTGYITGIIAVTRDFLALSRDHQRSRLKIKKVLFLSAAGLALFVTAISHYPSVIKLPPELDPSARLRGWNELGKEINKIYDPMSKEGHVLIFSDSYQVSSELAFYVKGHLKTYSINLGRRMNQYDLWPDINSGAMSIRRGKGEKSPGTINGIFVKMGDSEMPPEVARAFDRYEKKVLKVYDKNYLLREYSIFICYNFKGLKTEKPETY